MERPLISIVMPTFNRAEMLRDALESLVRQETGGKFDYEILVVDNASADATRETILRVADRSAVAVHYLYQGVPGDAPTRNCGVAQAKGDWLAFFDDDQRAASGWLAALYDTAQKTGAAVVGGAVHLDLPDDVLERLGSDVRRISLREIDCYKSIHPYTDKRLPGCGNALVARRVFDAIGPFDATLVQGGSDTDFFMRARAAGFELIYTPQAIIRHHIPPERLTPAYMRWDARQGGDTTACHDAKRMRRPRLAAMAAARLAWALTLAVPRMAWGWASRDPGKILGQKIRLWRAEAYVRRTLAILAPHWFPQRQHFAELEFRHGRTVGQSTSPASSSPAGIAT